jgi:quinohemoprotein ethanol dehydrogenase
VNATAAMVREGKSLYDLNCVVCHGTDAIAGPVPDLRYATAEVHAQLDSIVLGGARKALGMPTFADKLTAEKVKLIQAYVLSRAEAAGKAAKK